MQQLSKYREGNRLLDDAGTGGNRPPRVSINGNRFTLIDPAGAQVQVPSLPEGPALDIVFVDRNPVMSKLYWGKNYSPSEIAPPVCFSDNGVAPSASAQSPQSATCQSCPHNVIGSAISQISGARIKACGDFKKFAVVVRGHKGVYLFEIKPGSFKAWNAYTSFLSMQKLQDGGRPDLCDVITRVKFVRQGCMDFEAISLVDQPLMEQVLAVWKQNEQQDVTGMMIGKHDRPYTGMLAGPSVPAPQPVLTSAGAAPFVRPQAAPPPPPEPVPTQPLFRQWQQEAAVAPAPAPEEPKPRGRGRPKKEEPVQPAAPVAQHGIAQPATPPNEVSDRLNAVFKLPLS